MGKIWKFIYLYFVFALGLDRVRIRDLVFENLDFLSFSTATEQLAAQASWISYGPARLSSAALVTSYHNQPDLKMAPHMPTDPKNFTNAVQNNGAWWADNTDELNERFNAWLAN